tara:strand:+ start:700 stop:936 length:237 start_codon:yes stop_codon:yes gene_type:complete
MGSSAPSVPLPEKEEPKTEATLQIEADKKNRQVADAKSKSLRDSSKLGIRQQTLLTGPQGLNSLLTDDEEVTGKKLGK